MPDNPDPEHRSQFRSQAGDIQIREAEELESEEGVFEVRMPIATTGEVRNEGDTPLRRSELEGMARQIEERSIGVFLDHGATRLGGPERYTAVEKLGEWREASVQTREADDESELVATARLMEPESLPNGLGGVREAVGAIKEQVKRGFSLSSSIGWREDEDYPGGNDLMEASIVGIGADPRTTSDAQTAVLARAAVDAGADPEAFVSEVRAAVSDNTEREDTPEDARPFGPPGGPDDMWEDFEACVDDVEDWDGIDDPEAFCAVAETQSDADAPDDTTDHDMSDTDQTDDEPEAEQDGEPDDERVSGEEYREQMLSMQEQQTELLQGLAERMEGEDDEDPDDEDAMDEEEEDEEDEEQASDEPEEEQSAEESELDERIAELEDELEKVRNGEITPDVPEPDEEQDEEPDKERNPDKYGLNEVR